MTNPSGLAGRRVVVTAGGTREPVDPVRYLGNRSSGKMGVALARAARARGAEVFLVTAAPFPPDAAELHAIAADTAEEMEARVRDCLSPGAVLVMAAAVADYRPRRYSDHKLKKQPTGFSLELVPTVDILKRLGSDPIRGSLYVVGFAAETDDAVANGRSKVASKRLDLCVINDVSAPGIGMGADDNAVTIVDREGLVAEISRRPKSEVAEAILGVVEARIAESSLPASTA